MNKNSIGVLRLPGCSDERMAALTAALAEAGLDAVDAGAIAPARLVCFGDDGAAATQAWRAADWTAQASRTILVHLADAPLPAPQVWALLHAGAADVLEGALAQRVAASVAARVARWAAVDAALAHPAVRTQLIGASAAWRALLQQVVELACFCDRHLLVIGESGTGKELIARLVHTLDARADKRELVLLDCTTIHPELAGSEFFGHERGAYTGAAQARDGAFALADRGTLFLDEVGELPPTMQAQLLRVIQERQFKRLGSTQWQRSAFRLVCATHRNLDEEVRRGSFRTDLFHRIAACRVRVPPLRERREDIAVLAHHFLAELCPEGAPEIDDAVLAWLQQRDYAGNVRELRQLVERIAVRHSGPGPITVGDIPPDDRPLPESVAEPDWRHDGFDAAVAAALSQGAGLRDIGAHATATAIRLTLEATEGNLQRAARRLGVTDRALQLRRANGELAA